MKPFDLDKTVKVLAAMCKEPEVTTDEMFGNKDDDLTVKDQIRSLAEHIAIEMDAVDQLKKEHTKRKEALDSAKEKLSNILREAGMESCKLENGLTPKAKITKKFFKAAGVDDETLHGWLKRMQLGDIIIPYVHYQTLQSTLRTFEEQGGEISEEIINVSATPTVTMYGKAKFLESRKG